MPTAKLRRRNSPSGSIGSRRARLVQQEQRRSTTMPPISRHEHLRRAPAGVRLADQREHRPGEPERAQQPRRASRRARRAPARARAAGPRCATSTSVAIDERHVDRRRSSATRPRRSASRRRAARRPSRCPPTPSTSRSPPPRSRGREGRDDHRQRARRQQRAEDALQRARRRRAPRSSARARRAATRRRSRRRRARRPAARRTRRRASRRRGSASRASAGRRSTPTAGRRARRRGRRWIAGSATFTTVASSPATNEPMIAAARISRLRRGSRLGAAIARRYQPPRSALPAQSATARAPKSRSDLDSASGAGRGSARVKRIWGGSK